MRDEGGDWLTSRGRHGLGFTGIPRSRNQNLTISTDPDEAAPHGGTWFFSVARRWCGVGCHGGAGEA